MKTETFNVPGISCQHCVNAIAGEVGGLEGVKDVQVGLDDKMVRVQAEERVSRESIVAAIQEAGYEVSAYDINIKLNS